MSSIGLRQSTCGMPIFVLNGSKVSRPTFTFSSTSSTRSLNRCSSAWSSIKARSSISVCRLTVWKALLVSIRVMHR